MTYGYRSYDTFDTDPGSQLVVVHDWRTGAVRGVAVGNELGPRRVGAIGAIGAIGAVAVDVLANADADADATIFCSVGLAGTEAYLLAKLVS